MLVVWQLSIAKVLYQYYGLCGPHQASAFKAFKAKLASCRSSVVLLPLQLHTSYCAQCCYWRTVATHKGCKQCLQPLAGPQVVCRRQGSWYYCVALWLKCLLVCQIGHPVLLASAGFADCTAVMGPCCADLLVFSLFLVCNHVAGRHAGVLAVPCLLLCGRQAGMWRAGLNCRPCWAGEVQVRRLWLANMNAQDVSSFPKML